VLIESPPKKIGTEEGQAKKLISKGWEDIRQKNMMNEQMFEPQSKQKKAQYAYVF
jgi:hypothetical protein